MIRVSPHDLKSVQFYRVTDGNHYLPYRKGQLDENIY